MKVQLLSFPGCPHLEPARTALLRVATDLGLAVVIEEIDVSAEATPSDLRDWGSPTVLVDGEDVGGAAQPTGACCRLYDNAGHEHARGVPPDATIRAALMRASARRPCQ